MIIGMIAATDTSRNTTIISMCHLIKNAVSRQRVVQEVESRLKEKGGDTRPSAVNSLTHTDFASNHFPFLN